ncbi:ATP-binding protein [Mobiluncus mulieris]|uniref:ATP-binding protein n=1 Tax=Mobiluncus mulieris TaxID=2052 RepID=A0A7Y0U126_9ACTO|nr:ATP-binding protein [Mobiluncus mulieris]NMW65005.1 ATP-binding protein [Mobiluncus mulieris]
MTLRTSLAGRVLNTSLPKTRALLPLLEAIVNGIQAIDERYEDQVEQGLLEVKIQRDSQEMLDLPDVGTGREPLRPIVGFIVTDNGIGFTPDNMGSFETLDSDYKTELGCRGVGRLLWLKAFDCVKIRSAYYDNNKNLQSRSFKFSISGEIEQDDAPNNLSDSGSVVRLLRFKKVYQRYAPKTLEAISREIFEHCVWYFLRPGGAPKIIVRDEDNESLCLDSFLNDSGYSNLTRTTLNIKDEIFELLGIQLRSSSRNSAPRIYWCASNRVVKNESIEGKVDGLYSKMNDETGTEFTYVCYISSNYLDAQVRSDRTDFDLPEHIADGSLFEDISFEDIRKEVFVEISRALEKPLELARQVSRERIHNFVTTKAPQYRSLIKRIASRGMSVDPSISNRDLELVLHGYKQDIEMEILHEGQTLFSEANEERPEGYEEKLEKYIDTVKEMNQSDLANYVCRRRVTLDILARLIQADGDGKYTREDTIHKLLFPMKKDSTEVSVESTNLWILDERLVFHDYLASDKSFKSMNLVDSGSFERPDIISTRIIEPDTPFLIAENKKIPLQSITIVELKRPMRNDMKVDNNPIDQCLNYLSRIREGKTTTEAGRQITKSEDSPAFCYIVADLTTTMVHHCKTASLLPMQDGTGYFGFNPSFKAYIEVISFDRLVNVATERNRAFFDKLGLPSS